MSDTILSDDKKEYLVHAGADLQMPAGIAQTSPTTWVPDAASFSARRFLKPEENGLLSEKAKEEDKEQKRAYFPFSGRKHLCPGGILRLRRFWER
jgi:cytochrome P450